MTSAEESGTSSWYRVPTWSGNPAEWRQFRREMNWWMASLDEESCKKFNVAARWALRQYGVVRARCEEFDPQDLEGTKEEAMTDPDTGDKVIRLKREGIVMPEEELGWMLKERLGLDAIRKQLLETALAGRENYDVVESECLRLFRDLHSSDPLNKSRPFDKAPLLQRFLQSHDRHSSSSSYRPSTTASSTAPSSRSFRTQSSGSSRPPFKRFGQQPQPRQALIAEGYSPENLTIEEVLQTEAELLAQELQELETEGCDPRVLEDLESGMEQAAESLLTMREARTKIAEVKKDRGYGKPGQPAPRSTKPHGNQAPGAGLARPKGKPKSQMTKQVRVTETLNTEHVAPEEPDDMGHEVMTVAAGDSWDRPLFEVLMQHHTDPKNTPRLAQDKRFVGALDSACNRTCAGSSWLAFYLQALERAPSYIQNLIITTPENELFRFGNGGTQRSTVRYRLPMALGSTLVLVWVSIVPVPSLGLLLGRDFLSAIGAVLSFGRKLLRADLVGGELLELGQLAAGHFALPLQPRQWPRPDSQRWRKLGQDGIVELQLNSFDFWKKQLQLKMSHFEVPFESTSEAPHEHLVTEHAILAATSAGAQAMKDLWIVMEAAQHFDLTENDYTKVVLRWRRMLLRLRATAAWHAHGLLLWLLPRPQLRYAPFPYPSISHTRHWQEQAESMTLQKPKALMVKHWQRARTQEPSVYTTKNLLDLGQFRNRAGLNFAFMEDNMLQGMLAARASKGLTAQLKRDAIQEAQLEAEAATKRGEKHGMVRSLIGPKGGLPTLKADLVKLASLLNIPVQTGMTVEDLKKACRPLVAEIAQKPTPSKASGSTSSTERHVPETSMARPSQAPETIGAKAKASHGVTAQELQEVLTMQDHKFQGMLNQVLQSISTLHQASHLPGPMTSGPMETEATMDFGWTQDEIQQMNRDYYQDDLEWRQEVNEVYEEQWHRAMNHFQNEIFVTTLTVGDEKSFQSHAMSENRLISKNPDLVENDRFPKTFVTEVYTNTERVAQTARKRGHRVGASMSLESGWNFLRPLDRKAARAVLKRESPFFLVLAFPCSFWSVLLNLNPPKNDTKMYEEAITLLQFALQLAKDQKSRGCHFVLENPQSSRAWTLEEMQRALEQLEARCVVFHQCRFRLKNQALVVGMEKQFEADFKRPHNILAIEDGEEAEDETALPIDMNLSDSDQESTEAEAVSAYNSDINDAGVSPMQAAFGKQPRMHGDCLGDFGRRLSEHGLIDSRPSLARQVAMRETARLAMVRLHFSKGTSPFPEAVRAAFEQRRQSVSSAAPSASGESQASKRPAELDAERLREEALQPDPVAPTPAQPPDEVPDEASEALRVTHEVMEMEAYANVHPLRQIQIMAEQDRLNPLEARVRDHGTWRGNWPLPSRTEFKRRQMLKQLWPLGNDDAAQEVLAVLTARKEHVWSHMSDFEKKEFREAAAKGWSVWVENEAIEPLPDAEAARIRQKLKTEGESHRILVPRFVYVDKNDGLRTADRDLPLKANARLVVPGYQDISAYGLRCDAPTASRTSQHLLLTFAASMKWKLASADIKSAFMKGEEFGPNERILYLANVKTRAPDEPRLPFSEAGLCRVKKGVFGLADSPRRWYKRLCKSVQHHGWQLSALDSAMWFLWEGSKLEGILISHVDDLLLAGGPRAHHTLQLLGAELGFGSTSTGTITYCGKKIEQAEDFSVKVSMEEYHSNLQQPFDLSTDSVPLLVVTDAKDAFDKSCSETPSYGSQKSLAFTISWIRSMLARCNMSMRWTATENMIVDCGTKELDPQHLHKILRDCKWCVQFSSQYVKQTSKSKKPMANSQQTGRVVRSDMGVPFESSSPLFGHVMKLSQSSGWHVLNEDLAVNVCRQARSYRTPEPRCSRTTHAFRSTFARFDSEHSVIWRQLEDSVDMRELQNPRSMLEEPVALLVTVFSRCPTPQMPQEKGMNCES
ncbi:unnamed protein product [Durusdinium trenchii]|uniref:Reverse transcriptase Ty1/copia-type domain-containing protein n=1 Tax=Durusdinium trenchii TaxID=1381693 RepID=A0ABP0L981_9DINO